MKQEIIIPLIFVLISLLLVLEYVRGSRKNQYGVELRASAIPNNFGFNWGAFVLTPLWLLFHGKVGTGLLLILLNIVFQAAGSFGRGGVILVLFVQIAIMSYFGSVGNEIAWKKKGYTSLEELKKKQRGWNIAGILVGIFIVLPILLRNLYSLRIL